MKFFIIYQFAGGGLGLVLVIWSVVSNTTFTATSILVTTLISAFYLYSIFCGFELQELKKNSFLHTIINQSIQILGFAYHGFSFQYVAGIFFTLQLLPSYPYILFNSGLSTFDISINANTSRSELNINLIAIAILIMFLKNMRALNRKRYETLL